MHSDPRAEEQLRIWKLGIKGEVFRKERKLPLCGRSSSVAVPPEASDAQDWRRTQHLTDLHTTQLWLPGSHPVCLLRH